MHSLSVILFVALDCGVVILLMRAFDCVVAQLSAWLPVLPSTARVDANRPEVLLFTVSCQHLAGQVPLHCLQATANLWTAVNSFPQIIIGGKQIGGSQQLKVDIGGTHFNGQPTGMFS